MTDGTTDVSTPEMEQATTEDSTQELERLRREKEEMEEKYKNLQSDYTKKSQALAESKKEKTPEEEQLKSWIKDEGFVSKEELERRENEIMEKVKFNELLKNYPDLRTHETAIRDLQKTNGGTYEEVAIKYGFTTSDKLEKARNRDVMVGEDQKVQPKMKSVAEMSSSEYEKWKRDNIGSSDSFDTVQSF